MIILYTDCPQCGWVGPVSDLKDHPTRPQPMDFGFCPECGAEVDGDFQPREIVEARAWS